ncbi:MAG: AsmA family protein, partial [Bacteroidales bacterium]|nr:AsmA family protein [Bacteroidales bacterium]
MKIILKRIFIGLVVFLILLFGSTYLIVILNNDRIEKAVIGQINENLGLKMSADKIRFSLFETFPTISLTFSNVETEIKNGVHGPLFRAGIVAVEFNLIDIYRNNYSLRNLVFKDVYLNIIKTENQHGKIEIFKKRESSAEPSEENARIELDRILIKNLHLVYADPNSSTEFISRVPSARVVFKRLNENPEFDLSGRIDVEKLKTKNFAGFNSRQVDFEIAMAWNNQTKLLSLRSSSLQYGQLDITSSGQISFKKENAGYDITFNFSEADFSDYKKELPPELNQYINRYNFEGKLASIIQVKGIVGDPDLSMRAFYNIRNTNIELKKLNKTIRDISASGLFDASSVINPSSFRLTIDTLSGFIDSGQFRGNGSINNFNYPEVRAGIFADLNLEEMNDLIQNDRFSQLKGRIRFTCDYRNKIAGFTQFTPADFISSITTGDLTLSDCLFQLKGSRLVYKDLNGSFGFSNEDLIIINLTGKAGKNDFEMAGSFNNLLPWIFFPDESFVVKATYYSGLFDLQEFIPNETSSTDSLVVSDKIELKLHLDIDTFRYKKFNANNISGDFRLINSHFIFRNMKLNTLGGDVSMDGSINAQNLQKYEL